MTRLGQFFLGLILVFLYTPILVLMAMGFNESELYELPFKFSTRWYSALASNTELLTSSFNSIILAVVTAVVATAIGTLAALALSRRTFRGRSLLQLLLLPPIAIPWLITGTAMLIFFFWTGTFTSLLGPFGSGKTTLLRIIAGFVALDQGEVTIGDKDVTGILVWGRNIGMMFQSYALFPHMTVARNVAFGLERRGIKGAEAAKAVAESLEMVHLSDFGDRMPKNLSGGQQQRVALARAMVIKPSVLLLDEPLSALARRLRQEMQVELLRIQRQTGLTTIFVTHDQEEALTLSDRIAILDKGRIVQAGAPEDIYENPQTRFAAEFLGDSNFLTGVVDSGGVRLPDGTQIQTTAPLPANGQKATLAIRPEKMSPTPMAGATNQIAAQILTVIYAGPALSYLLQTPDGTLLKLFQANRDGTLMREGDTITLHWSAAHSIPVQD